MLLIDKICNIINVDVIVKMCLGFYIINCVCGGFVDEVVVCVVFDEGKLVGVVFDVFVDELVCENVFFGVFNFVFILYLGVFILEVQENVVLQVVEQMCDYLLDGVVWNVFNMLLISVEEVFKFVFFVWLVEQFGLFVGQFMELGIEGVWLEYVGLVVDMNVNVLIFVVLIGLFILLFQMVNMVFVLIFVKECGMQIEEVWCECQGVYEIYICLMVVIECQEWFVVGIVFGDGKLWIIQVKGINMEVEFGEYMFYIINEDKFGFIGYLGMEFGNNGVNIVMFNFGCMVVGQDVICFVEVDGLVLDVVMSQFVVVFYVKQVKLFQF